LYSFPFNNPPNCIDTLGCGVGVLKFRNADGSEEVKYTYTPAEKPSGFREILAALWAGSGHAESKSKACEQRCDELKRLLVKAYLAADVYESRNGGEVQNAPMFQRLSDQQLTSLGIAPQRLVDSESGFYSALYYNALEDKYVVAFRGTEGLFAYRDWESNLRQGVGAPAKQYQEAAQLGVLLSAPVFKSKISGVGHSLGGGLDTVAALKGQFAAVNFNSAGMHSYTAQRMGLNFGDEDKLVSNYSVPGDPLSRMANRTYLLPITDGRQTLLPSPLSAPLLLNRHGIDNVIAAIQRLLDENGCK
jgi:hypothetical protein